MDVANYTLADLAIGHSEAVEVDVRQEDIDRFCEISGDVSPIHTDEAFARSRGFDGRVAHGFLIGALVSRLIGNRLPGRYGILTQIQMNFRKSLVAPARVRIEGTITAISQGTGLLTIAITVKDAHQILISNGEVKSILRSP